MKINPNIFENKSDRWFRSRGFLVQIPGEVYEYRLYERVSVYVWKEPGKWIVYRVSHYPGGKIKFDKVLKEFRLNDGRGLAGYVTWYIKNEEDKKKRKRGKAG